MIWVKADSSLIPCQLFPPLFTQSYVPCTERKSRDNERAEEDWNWSKRQRSWRGRHALTVPRRRRREHEEESNERGEWEKFLAQLLAWSEPHASCCLSSSPSEAVILNGYHVINWRTVEAYDIAQAVIIMSFEGNCMSSSFAGNKLDIMRQYHLSDDVWHLTSLTVKIPQNKGATWAAPWATWPKLQLFGKKKHNNVSKYIIPIYTDGSFNPLMVIDKMRAQISLLSSSQLLGQFQSALAFHTSKSSASFSNTPRQQGCRNFPLPQLNTVLLGCIVCDHTTSICYFSFLWQSNASAITSMYQNVRSCVNCSGLVVSEVLFSCEIWDRRTRRRDRVQRLWPWYLYHSTWVGEKCHQWRARWPSADRILRYLYSGKTTFQEKRMQIHNTKNFDLTETSGQASSSYWGSNVLTHDQKGPNMIKGCALHINPSIKLRKFGATSLIRGISQILLTFEELQK